MGDSSKGSHHISVLWGAELGRPEAVARKFVWTPEEQWDSLVFH